MRAVGLASAAWIAAGTCCASFADPVEVAVEEVSLDRLLAVVVELASEGYEGRGFGTPGGLRAAERIAAWMAEAGAAPLGPDGYLRPFESRGKRGVNVAGMVEGSDPALRREYVVVCAHHDHLGRDERGIYRGADDNASGVAVLLEAVRAACRMRAALRRSVLFVSFDGEESGLVGSAAWLKAPEIDPGSLAALICLDLVGGDLYPGDDRSLYAIGAESSPDILRVVRTLGTSVAQPRIEIIGVYAIEPFGPLLARSDYGSFRKAGVPFVFFSTGTPWYYHTLDDVPERLNRTKLHANARLVVRAMHALAGASARPTFEPRPEPPVEDRAVFARHLKRILAASERIGLGPNERAPIADALASLTAAPADAPVDADTGRLVQRAMVALFTALRRAGR